LYVFVFLPLWWVLKIHTWARVDRVASDWAALASGILLFASTRSLWRRTYFFWSILLCISFDLSYCVKVITNPYLPLLPLERCGRLTYCASFSAQVAKNLQLCTCLRSLACRIDRNKLDDEVVRRRQ
jgi:hypothetical protein